MKKMMYTAAIREAMSRKMREDKNVLLIGEDVGLLGGCFGLSAGMLNEFGEERVRDTPISEQAIIGGAVGAAMTGLRPVAEIMFADFVAAAMDQIVNQAAKMRYMTGGKVSVPMVVRLPFGGYCRSGPQHAQMIEAWFTHVPGLKVVFPSTAEDAYGLMLSAIEDDNPVIFVEHKSLYFSEIGEVDENMAPIPLGKAKIRKEGADATIICYGMMTKLALAAAEELAKENISVEVLDLRSLFPLDEEAILASVAKTGRVVLVSEEILRGGYIGDIAAMIADKAFGSLKAPVKRVAALNAPVPYPPYVEDAMLPSAQDIVNAVKATL